MINSKIFIDGKGKLSSKRVIGILLMAIASIMACILFSYSLELKAEDPETSLTLIYYLLITSGGLLGIGTFEKKK